MNDPFQVLGIPESATDEEVKRAYRELARKYHPDNYHDNPLADLAEEKMKDINAAYEEINRRRSGGSGYSGASGRGGGTYGGGGGTSGGYGGTSRQYSRSSRQYSRSSRQYGEGSPLQQARMAIRYGDLTRAEAILADSNDRGAEWHFLRGALCYRRGWMDEARHYYETAVRMDPSNDEYRQALNYMERGTRTVWTPGGAFGTELCAPAPCLPFWCCVLPLCCG